MNGHGVINNLSLMRKILTNIAAFQLSVQYYYFYSCTLCLFLLSLLFATLRTFGYLQINLLDGRVNYLFDVCWTLFTQKSLKCLSKDIPTSSLRLITQYTLSCEPAHEPQVQVLKLLYNCKILTGKI